MSEDVAMHKPTRITSKYVNDSFHFLKFADSGEVYDGGLRESSVSDKLLTFEEHVIMEKTESEFTSSKHADKVCDVEIVTSVDNDREVIVNGIANKADLVNESGTEFTIVTFVDNKLQEDKGFKEYNNEPIVINPVYEVHVTEVEICKPSQAITQNNTEQIHVELNTESQNNEVNTYTSTLSEDTTSHVLDEGEMIVPTRNSTNEPEVDNLAQNNRIDMHNSSATCRENTTSVLIGEDEVELRSPPGEATARQSRQLTWRKNQQFVSEAFQFLKAEDIGDTEDVGKTEDVDKTGLVNDECCHSCNQILVSNGETLVCDCERLSHVGQVIPQTTSQLRQQDTGQPESVETDSTAEMQQSNRKLRRRKKPSEAGTGDGEADSSDEDTGVYRESFRKSTWLYVGDNEDIKEGRNQANYISLTDLGVDTCDNDSIFGDGEAPVSPLLPPNHKRNASTSTTVSEREFRNQFNSVSRRFVQRADSQQEYKRFTKRYYDNVKSITLNRDSSLEFGIHLLDSKPTVISGVDAGSAAELAGLREGQIVIALNGVNVLEADHDEIISLVQQDSTTLSLDLGSGDMSAVQDLQVPVITGYLQKQVSSTIFRTWKKRFFILRRDNCLYYYKHENGTDPLGAIPLNGYTVSRHGDLNKFGFKAEKYSCKTFYFMAVTREHMTNWVGAMNGAAQKGKNKDSWMDVTADNVGLPALNIRNPDCSGYLFKIGRSTRLWRKRYCVLKDACIYYYKQANSKEADGVAHLHGYTVEGSGISGKKYSFNVRPPEPQMRTFSFYTHNDTDKLRWVRSLNSSIKKWVKVD